jgi:hypothetical protein
MTESADTECISLSPLRSVSPAFTKNCYYTLANVSEQSLAPVAMLTHASFRIPTDCTRQNCRSASAVAAPGPIG